MSTAHYFPINGAQLTIQKLEQPLSSALPASMRVTASNSTGKVGFKNEGYWGIDVRQQKYTGSFWVKGAYKGHFTASLQSNLTNETFGSVQVESKAVASEWTEHEFELVPEKDAPNSNNTFAITFDPKGTANGTLDFNLISLFPPTYKGRKNGLRIDIAEALADMNPVSVVHQTTHQDMKTNFISSISFVSQVVTCSKVSQMPLTGTGRTPWARSRIALGSKVSGTTSKHTVSD